MSYHTDEKVIDHYKFEDELGKGAFAVVKRAVHRQNGKKYAIKCIDRRSLGDDEENNLQLEVEILSGIDHPNVV
jgi:serine/threonine protein kinase